MTRDVPEPDIEELRELARRLHPAAQVLEQAIDDHGTPAWSLAIHVHGIDSLEVRGADRRRARRSVMAALVELLGEQGLLRSPEVDAPNFSDEPVIKEGAYVELASVLDAATTEQQIQECLERHPEVWTFLTSTKPQVIPKMPLGHDFVTDFVVFGAAPWSQMQRPTATFIELERADAALFTAKGDPTAALTHGQRQLRNWRQWIRDSKQQVRDYMLDKTYLDWERHRFEGQPAGLPAFGFDDHYLLVIGRRSSMSPAQRWQLHQICEEFPKIITYDMLLDALCPEAPYRLPWVYND